MCANGTKPRHLEFTKSDASACCLRVAQASTGREQVVSVYGAKKSKGANDANHLL